MPTVSRQVITGAVLICRAKGDIMKRTISLILALLLLLSTATVFSACRKKNQTTEETADWNEYVVVYNDAGFSPLGDAVKDVLTRLQARTGESPARESTDDGGDVETEDYEIIIGATDRAATEAAKDRIEGNGWCILPTGKKTHPYHHPDGSVWK